MRFKQCPFLALMFAIWALLLPLYPEYLLHFFMTTVPSTLMAITTTFFNITIPRFFKNKVSPLISTARPFILMAIVLHILFTHIERAENPILPVVEVFALTVIYCFTAAREKIEIKSDTDTDIGVKINSDTSNVDSEESKVLDREDDFQVDLAQLFQWPDPLLRTWLDQINQRELGHLNRRRVNAVPNVPARSALRSRLTRELRDSRRMRPVLIPAPVPAPVPEVARQADQLETHHTETKLPNTTTAYVSTGTQTIEVSAPFIRQEVINKAKFTVPPHIAPIKDSTTDKNLHVISLTGENGDHSSREQVEPFEDSLPQPVVPLPSLKVDKSKHATVEDDTETPVYDNTNTPNGDTILEVANVTHINQAESMAPLESLPGIHVEPSLSPDQTTLATVFDPSNFSQENSVVEQIPNATISVSETVADTTVDVPRDVSSDDHPSEHPQEVSVVDEQLHGGIPSNPETVTNAAADVPLDVSGDHNPSESPRQDSIVELNPDDAVSRSETVVDATVEIPLAISSDENAITTTSMMPQQNSVIEDSLVNRHPIYQPTAEVVEESVQSNLAGEPLLPTAPSNIQNQFIATTANPMNYNPVYNPIQQPEDSYNQTHVDLGVHVDSHTHLGEEMPDVNAEFPVQEGIRLQPEDDDHSYFGLPEVSQEDSEQLMLQLLYGGHQGQSTVPQHIDFLDEEMTDLPPEALSAINEFLHQTGNQQDEDVEMGDAPADVPTSLDEEMEDAPAENIRAVLDVDMEDAPAETNRRVLDEEMEDAPTEMATTVLDVEMVDSPPEVEHNNDEEMPDVPPTAEMRSAPPGFYPSPVPTNTITRSPFSGFSHHFPNTTQAFGTPAINFTDNQQHNSSYSSLSQQQTPQNEHHPTQSQVNGSTFTASFSNFPMPFVAPAQSSPTFGQSSSFDFGAGHELPKFSMGTKVATKSGRNARNASHARMMNPIVTLPDQMRPTLNSSALEKEAVPECDIIIRGWCRETKASWRALANQMFTQNQTERNRSIERYARCGELKVVQHRIHHILKYGTTQLPGLAPSWNARALRYSLVTDTIIPMVREIEQNIAQYELLGPGMEDHGVDKLKQLCRTARYATPMKA